MYDASTIGAPPKPFSNSFVIGLSFGITVAIILVMTGTMLFPDIPALRVLAAGAALIAASAFVIHLKMGPRFESILMIVGLPILAWGMVDIASTVRGDHEINEAQYRWVARTLRERPEVARLIAPARADRVVTNDEYAAFQADLGRYDRSKVLGD